MPAKLRVPLSLLLLAFAAIAAWHFVGRYRVNAATRLQGADTIVTDRTRDLAVRLAEIGPDATLRERRELALAICFASLRDAPFSPFVWRETGSRLFQLGRNDEADAFLAVARRIDPQSAELRLQIGNELALRRSPKAAFADWRAALRIDPKRASGTWQTCWALGYDPVALVRAMLPGQSAVFRAYLGDALRALSPAEIDALWERLGPSLPYADAANALLWRSYLRSAYEEVRRTTGDANRVARERAMAVRERVLVAAYGDDLSVPANAFLAPGGVPPQAGIFNAALTLPLLQAGVGDWTLAGNPAFRKQLAVREPRPDMPWPDAGIAANGQPPHTGDAGNFLHIVFEGLTPVTVAAPSQVLLLPGPATYTLQFEVATSRLFTPTPFRLEVACWSMNFNARPVATVHRSEPFAGQRPPRAFSLVFHVPAEDDGPQTLRLARDAGGSQDPPVEGELFLRFLRLTTAPLDPAYVRRTPVDSETFQRALDQSAPSVVDLLDTSD